MATLPNQTAEALQAEIEATRRQVEEQQAREQELNAAIDQAKQRQRLRRELDGQKRALDDQLEKNTARQTHRIWIDGDLCGPHLPEGTPARLRSMDKRSKTCDGESINFGHMVSKLEYVWKLESLSWLKAWLHQEDADSVFSDSFQVGDVEFDLGYTPDGGTPDEEQNGTLVIRCWGNKDQRIAFRYRIFVKSRLGDFVQWGDTRDEFYECANDFECWLFGPDAHEPSSKPASLQAMGIFGLTHQQLLESEWVENDTLTVKFVLEVRPQGNCSVQNSSTHLSKPAVEVPGPTMTSDMQSFWEKGICGDVQFKVQGESISAHSPVLCARSDVFEKQLTGGLQESVSKVITVEDCDPATFKAFLQFLYTDDITFIEDLGSLSGETDSSSRASMLQALLAVSHKYQVRRLQLWCEKELSQKISLCEVCGLLRQAYLLQTQALERACLTYIKEHLAEVLKLPAYSDLLAAWPQIGLKVSLFSAGVTESEAAAVLDTFKEARSSGKRKREDDL